MNNCFNQQIGIKHQKRQKIQQATINNYYQNIKIEFSLVNHFL